MILINMPNCEMGRKYLMTKYDLIKITSENSGHTETKCRFVIESFLNIIPEIISLEKNIELRYFGTFILQERKARPARNIRTGEVCLVPYRKTLVLKYSEKIKNNIGT